MCAQLLDKYVQEKDRYSTLAAAPDPCNIAAKLGAKGITAIDIDQVAIRVYSRKTVVLNKVETKY